MTLKKYSLLAYICGFMIVLHIINMITGYSLNHFGIKPRALVYLPSIFSSPFLHGSIGHLVNNLSAFIVLSALCILRSRSFYINSSLFIVVVGGLFVWLFARHAIHIGASGWLFGLWSLHIALAVFERKWLNIIIAALVVIFYGGMIWGILPQSRYISFEAHLGGAIAGVLWAFIVVSHNTKKDKYNG